MSEVMVEPERRVDLVALAKSVRLTSRRSKKTERTLQEHVEGCAKMQRRVLYIAAVTLAWVVGHSPEVLKPLSEIARSLFP